jgi:hypothetical protein
MVRVRQRPHPRSAIRDRSRNACEGSEGRITDAVRGLHCRSDDSVLGAGELHSIVRDPPPALPARIQGLGEGLAG